VPDEFDKWVKNTISDLKYARYQHREYCGKLHDGFRYGKFGDVDPEPTRKEYAEYLEKHVDSNLHGLMWAMWDKNHEKQDEIIWKMVKPKYQKPFWSKEDK